MQHERRALSWVALIKAELTLTADQINTEVTPIETIALGSDASPFDRDFCHLRNRELTRELSGVLDRNGAAAVLAVCSAAAKLNQCSTG